MVTTEKRKASRGYPMGKTLGRLIQGAYRDDKGLFLRLFVHTFAGGIHPLVGVALPKLVLEEVSKGAGARLSTLLFTVAILLLVAILMGYTRTYTHYESYFRMAYLRLEYIRLEFMKLAGMSYRYVEDAGFSNEHQMALEATQTNNTGLEGVLHELFEAPAEALTALLLMALVGIHNPIILLGLIVHVGMGVFIGSQVHHFRHSRHEEMGKAFRRRQYYQRTTHDFGYGKDIRIYGLKERVMAGYRQEIQRYAALFRAIAQRRFALGFLGLLTLLISDGLSYGILCRDVVRGLSIADFSMQLSALIALSATLTKLGERGVKIASEGEYVSDFFRFLDLPLEDEQGGHGAIPGEALEIVFRDVSFRYPGSDKDIFTGLNLTIAKGEKLAVVGVNGAGKTTLVKLMMGLFTVTGGEIRINGKPLESYDRKALFSMFAPVFQDVNVMAFTLLENIACGPNGDRQRAEAAIRQAGLWEKAESLEKGMDQPMLKIIEEDGAELSGGEKQKLAIARALYKGGNMVVMDEPTAALDALAELAIYEQFAQLVAGRTALFISHRLASTQFCDKIAFFDEGGLKEYGTHEELMALGGAYHHMFTVQGKYYSGHETEGGPQ